MNRPHLDTWKSFGGDYEYHFKPALEFKDKINREGASAFMAGNPSFPASAKNAQALFDWCEAQQVPLTRKNLEVAWRELRAEGKLEQKFAEQETTKAVADLVIRPVEAAQVAPPTKKEQAVLVAVKDDPALNDRQRKARDEKLKRAATQSRLANRKTAAVRG
jgi:hypothetical protein